MDLSMVGMSLAVLLDDDLDGRLVVVAVSRGASAGARSRGRAVRARLGSGRRRAGCTVAGAGRVVLDLLLLLHLHTVVLDDFDLGVTGCRQVEGFFGLGVVVAGSGRRATAARATAATTAAGTRTMVVQKAERLSQHHGDNHGGQDQ